MASSVSQFRVAPQWHLKVMIAAYLGDLYSKTGKLCHRTEVDEKNNGIFSRAECDVTRPGNCHLSVNGVKPRRWSEEIQQCRLVIALKKSQKAPYVCGGRLRGKA
jgi:hypothetical protein